MHTQIRFAIRSITLPLAFYAAAMLTSGMVLGQVDTGWRKTDSTFERYINRSPSVAAIPDQQLCYTSGQQVIMLRNISASEYWQSTTLEVSSDNNDLFEKLSIHPLSNGNGFIKYALKKNASGRAVVTVKVKDDGGTAEKGIDEFSRSFAVTVFAPPDIRLRASIAEIPFADPKTSAGTLYQPVQLEAGAAAAARYSWFPADGLDDPSSARPLFTPAGPVPHTITLLATNERGCSSIDSIIVIPKQNPGTMSMTVYPNPSSRSAVINFMLPAKEESVSLDVYTSSGVKIRNLFSGGVQAKRTYNVKMNGAGWSAGVYYIRLSSPLHDKEIKWVMLK